MSLSVNGKRRQHGALTDLVWTVPDILHELSRLYVLRAGDLVFMGTPAGVGPLQPGDAFVASLDGVVTLQGSIAPLRSEKRRAGEEGGHMCRSRGVRSDL